MLTVTKRTVDRLSVRDRDAVFWDRDIPGFGVRVYPSGAKVYVVQTRASGKSRQVTIGRHGDVSPDQARWNAVETISAPKAVRPLSNKDETVEPTWPTSPNATCGNTWRYSPRRPPVRITGKY